MYGAVVGDSGGACPSHGATNGQGDRAMVFMTTTVRQWTPVFTDVVCARSILQQLHGTLLHNQLSLAAYVVMPSHLHLLLGFREIEQLSRMMQEFKSLSSRRLRPILPPELDRAFDKKGRFQFWKPRFDDLIISSEKQFRTKVDYIHRNPVKAGLVAVSTDYPYSSAGDWLLDEPGLVPADKEWVWLDDSDG